MRRVAFAAVALLPMLLGAQSWRTVEASRQLRDTSGSLAVRIAYGAGQLRLGPSSGTALYDVALRYDAERSEPVTRFDSAARTLSLGMRSRGLKLGGGDHDAGSFRGTLSTRVPMELVLELGAVEGAIDLSGLRLRDLVLKTGAADLEVRFEKANPERMRALDVDVGAATLTIVGAANAGADRMRANVAAGKLDLDLSGTLTRDLDVSLNVAIGHCTLRASMATGVAVDATVFIAEFAKAGLEKRGDTWYTPGFDQAARKIRVRVTAVMGGFALKRTL